MFALVTTLPQLFESRTLRVSSSGDQLIDNPKLFLKYHTDLSLECCPPCAEDLAAEAAEAKTHVVEKRQGLIGFQCYPWMLCWPHGPKEVIAELEAKNSAVEKRQGLIGFQVRQNLPFFPFLLGN
jgi:hypothetical protein